MLEELGNAQKVRIAGLVQLTVRVKPATKARQGRNPRDRRGDHDRGQAPSVDLRARPLAKAKAALPTGAEGAPPTRGVKWTRLAVAPARLIKRTNAKPDKGRLPRSAAVRDGGRRGRPFLLRSVAVQHFGSHAVATSRSHAPGRNNRGLLAGDGIEGDSSVAPAMQ